MTFLSYLSKVPFVLGAVLGNISYSEFRNFLKTIGDAVQIEKKKLLDLEGNKSDEEGLVLAQKYRENGTVKPGEDRNFNNQQNPGFLSEENGNTYVKGIDGKGFGSVNESSNWSKEYFKNDSEIAKLLKKRCKEALSEKYESGLYKSVSKGCTLELPTYMKNIIKMREQLGGCRLGFVNSSYEQNGYFLTETLHGSILPERFLQFEKVLSYILNKDKGVSQELSETISSNFQTNFQTKCMENKGKHLEIHFAASKWDIKSNGGQAKHKIPPSTVISI